MLFCNNSIGEELLTELSHDNMSGHPWHSGTAGIISSNSMLQHVSPTNDKHHACLVKARMICLSGGLSMDGKSMFLHTPCHGRAAGQGNGMHLLPRGLLLQL